ncbi:hypothetical protein ALC53_08517 [Atta colombica]|uniref:Uncharacterized protein n=1 Tax=Atta colombica TaxID=520822 RepID=A0A195BAF4_9HYME|nr:hypothetical protein ALC53_08517 [Atta colombica]
MSTCSKSRSIRFSQHMRSLWHVSKHYARTDDLSSWNEHFAIAISIEHAKGEIGEEEERKAQWCVPRDTRECVFSLVTVTPDALARIGPMQRPYEATLRSERRAYVISACRETAFRYLSCKEHVREVRANKRNVIAHPHFGRASGGRIVTIYSVALPCIALHCISPNNADFISSLATTRGATVAGPYDRMPSCTAILVKEPFVSVCER